MTSEQLEQRLRRGEILIADASTEAERQRLEDYWLQLLAEYERTVDAERRQGEERAA